MPSEETISIVRRSDSDTSYFQASRLVPPFLFPEQPVAGAIMQCKNFFARVLRAGEAVAHAWGPGGSHRHPCRWRSNARSHLCPPAGRRVGRSAESRKRCIGQLVMTRPPPRASWQVPARQDRNADRYAGLLRPQCCHAIANVLAPATLRTQVGHLETPCAFRRRRTMGAARKKWTGSGSCNEMKAAR
jgi:hypothetical protein